MPAQLSEYPIRKFGTIASLLDTTDMEGRLETAKNCKLRPFGAISGPPIYFRLWAIGSVTNIYDTLDGLTHPSGSGTLSNSDLTVAVRIYRQGVNFLLLYSMPDRACRGFFYLGRDGSYSGPIDLDIGPPSYEVLAVGLDRNARWYGKRAYSQLFLNNGVDLGVVVQLNRAKTPGKWRIAASNDKPGAPVVSLVTPGSSTLVQAYWTIPGANSQPFTADPATDTLTTSAPHNMVDGTIVQLTTTGALPTGLSTGTDYYVIAGTASTMKLSTSLGGVAVNFTTAGSGTNTVAAYGTTRAGTASITFTANALNFPGVAGNDKIKVAIVFSPYGGALSSTLTGSGTSADPYIYTILTTTSGNTTDAVVTFVNADTKVLAILSAAKSAADTTADLANYGPTLLSQGSGTGTSEGFSNRTVTIYARYFDSGAEFLGYEGISSPISNTLIISAAVNSDIRVSVPIDPMAGGGRFDQIRIYMQFGEALAAIWNLMDGDTPISNLARTGSFLANIATDSLISYSGAQFVSGVNTGTDTVTVSTANIPNGTAILFVSSGSVPGGLTGYTVYYAVQSSGFTLKVSATIGGTAINLTTAGTGSIEIYNLSLHGLELGDAVTLSASSGVLPTPLTATQYFVIVTTPYTWKISATIDGTAINLTAAGSPPVTYTLTSKSIQLGTTSTIGQIMSVDQNRPLPHVSTAIANEQTWRGGVTGFQDRLYVSKPARNDELAPEGANSEAYERVEAPNGTTGAPRMTALYSDGFKIHVHTASGVTLIDPTDTSKRYSPPVICGALNQSTLIPWPGKLIYYLGADSQLYTIQGTRYGRQQVDFASADAARYVLDRVDADVSFENPDMTQMMADVTGQMLWYFLPAPDSPAIAITGLASTEVITSASYHGLRLMDPVIFPTLTGGAGLTAGTTIYYVKTVPSALTFTVSATPGGTAVNITTNITAGTFAKTMNRLGFAYDFLAKGLLGEYNYPNVYDSATMEPQMPFIIFGDPQGNLFFIDSRTQLDHGDSYGTQTAPIPRDINVLPPVQWDGYGMVDFNMGNGTNRYYPATLGVFQTGQIDLGRNSNRKQFAGLIWDTVMGSQGLVKVQFTGMNSNINVTRIFGSMADYGYQCVTKILCALNLSAVKVTMTVVTCQQSAWTVRGMTMIYRAVRQL